MGRVALSLTGAFMWGMTVPLGQASGDSWKPGGDVRCSGNSCEVSALVKPRTPRNGRAALTPDHSDESQLRAEPGSRPGSAPTGSTRPGGGVTYYNGRCWVTIPESKADFVAIDCYGDEKESAPEDEASSPGQLSWLAVERLQLPAPALRMNPSADTVQMVGVPTWLWLDRSGWRPVSETARVPGLSVTATARPVRVAWSMGEGGRVVCDGPGTPYSMDYPAGAHSPDCSYTYIRSSFGEPEGKFQVSAAVTWEVTWEGGGESGQVPDLTTLGEVPVTVEEIQALVTRSDGR